MLRKSTSKLELFFFSSIILLVFIVIIFLCVIMNNQIIENVVLSNRNTTDIQTIMSVTDNAINKIYNVLVVSTIFFTILMASMTLFQFIKAKDVDNLKSELNEIIDNYKSVIDEKICENNDKLAEVEAEYHLSVKSLKEDFDKEVASLEKDYNQYSYNFTLTTAILNDKAEKLRRKSAELEVDINYYEAKNLVNNDAIPLMDVRKHYERILELINEYPDLKPDSFLINVYLGLSDTLISLLTSVDNKEEVYPHIKRLLDKALICCRTEHEEEMVYRYMLELNRDNGNIELEISLLEKIYGLSANEFMIYGIDRKDTEITIELAATLDKRNQDGDLLRAIDYIRETIKQDESIGEERAKNFLELSLINNEFKNLMNSAYKEEVLNYLPKGKAQQRTC